MLMATRIALGLLPTAAPDTSEDPTPGVPVRELVDHAIEEADVHALLGMHDLGTVAHLTVMTDRAVQQLLDDQADDDLSEPDAGVERALDDGWLELLRSVHSPDVDQVVRACVISAFLAEPVWLERWVKRMELLGVTFHVHPSTWFDTIEGPAT